MSDFFARVLGSLIIFGLIELVDFFAANFDLSWYWSLLIGVVISFGGFLVITEADLT